MPLAWCECVARNEAEKVPSKQRESGSNRTKLSLALSTIS